MANHAIDVRRMVWYGDDVLCCCMVELPCFAFAGGDLVVEICCEDGQLLGEGGGVDA